jgi:hypothetical protein
MVGREKMVGMIPPLSGRADGLDSSGDRAYKAIGTARGLSFAILRPIKRVTKPCKAGRHLACAGFRRMAVKFKLKSRR